MPKPPEPIPPKTAPSSESVLAPEPLVAVPAGAEASAPTSEPRRLPALAEAGGESGVTGSVAAPITASGERPPTGTSAGGGADRPEPLRVPQAPQPTLSPPRPASPQTPASAPTPPASTSPNTAEVEALISEADQLGLRLDRAALQEAASKDPGGFPALAVEVREGMRERAAGLSGKAAQIQAEFRAAGEHFEPRYTGPGRPRPEVALSESRAVAAEVGVPISITADGTVMTRADFPDITPGGRTLSTRPAPKALAIRASSGQFTERTVGRSGLQNVDVWHDVELLEHAGAKDIRINQAQVDARGRLKLGTNRPDVQAMLNGRRIHIEYDRAPGDRAMAHARRILVNDPDAIVILKIVDF
jgi:hypothetical protein